MLKTRLAQHALSKEISRPAAESHQPPDAESSPAEIPGNPEEAPKCDTGF